MNIKLKAEYFDYEGRGIAYDNDRTYFIENLLPGETGECEITKTKGNLSFGICKKLFESSPIRSSYPYTDITNLSHLKFEEQLKFQEDLTKKTFDKFKIDFKNFSKIVYNNNSTGYRNKVTMQVSKKGILQLGSYLKETNTFAYIKNITIPKEIEDLILLMNEYYLKNDIRNNGIEQVVFRINEDSEIMVIFKAKLDIDNNIYEILKENQNIISIYENKKLLYGNETIKYIINNIKYEIGPSSFFQVNTSLIKDMYQAIYDNIDKGSILLDAFSGISSISLYVKDKPTFIYSIERDKEATTLALKNIEENNINNIKVINGDFFKVFNKYVQDIDIALFDPPRAGLNKEVTDILLKSHIKKIIYLSCNLKTLCRDLKNLEDKYKIEKVIPFKNFPQTAETETLVVLLRK